MGRPWVVLKFGGTSVATAARWREIASIAAERGRAHRVWIVVSAVRGATDLLERAMEEAIRGEYPGAEGADWETRAASRPEGSPAVSETRPASRPEGSPAVPEARAASPHALSAVQEIRARYEQLAQELEVPFASVAARFEELNGWLSGIRLTGEASPRLRARVLATGELLSSQLGAAWFEHTGHRTRWVDARELLVADKVPAAIRELRMLDAPVTPVKDAARAEALAQDADVVITQGFIARAESGDTVLLGRGGSDTSAALFAALLGAAHLEIWSDVPGLFTADPRLLPTARLIRRIDPREAQELAASGARALHPRAIDPVAGAGIPLWLRSTLDPQLPGTTIERTGEDHPVVHGVTHRTGVTLVSISTVSMFERAGFMADVFAPFADLDVSVDLVGTSQSAVSVTLDRVPGGVRGGAFESLLDRLRRLGEVRVVHPCAVVSIVGRRIRAVLHDLGPALEVLQDRSVHLVSDSAEDLNLSFVVDEADGPFLVARLHERLFPAQGEDGRLGPTWEQMEYVRGRGKVGTVAVEPVHGAGVESMHGAVGAESVRRVTGAGTVHSVTGVESVRSVTGAESVVSVTGAASVRSVTGAESARGVASTTSRRGVEDAEPWWRRERERLLELMQDGQPRYVYHLPSVRAAAEALTRHLSSVDQFFYSMKANAHPAILRALLDAGFGFECVSAAEIALARRVVGETAPVLFTPSFCPPSEYADAFAARVEVTIDNTQTLQDAEPVFRGREIGLRVDPGRGAGHHRHVKTAGAGSKFGIPLAELETFRDAAQRVGARVVGLHAHVGSGVLDPAAWGVTAEALLDVTGLFADVGWIDLGGGIGVPDRPGQPRFDLEGLESVLQSIVPRLAGRALRLEPGRFLVSEAGVLLAPVTQARRKRGVNLAGLGTGMNSLIRPALYGAWHGIFNLTRVDEDATDYWDIVGPICESADVLGRDRWLPAMRPGDVVLIANAGAYGRVMSSQYNQREPAEEVVLED